MAGVLYVVATPIGNLGDFSDRARAVLAAVKLVAAEDTRHSGRLLSHFNIRTPMISLHEQNESARVPDLLAQLRAGDDIAIISDAGTPLVSDPGFRLVRAAAEAGVQVSPVPGPCAAVAALSVSGLPTDSFWFEGFLPTRRGARVRRLEALAGVTGTLVIYLSPHRLTRELADLVRALGGGRAGTLCRELTKRHEQTARGTLQALRERAEKERDLSRGEIVLVVEGAARGDGDETARREQMRRLLACLSARDAVTALVALTGCSRNAAKRIAASIETGDGEG